MTKPELDRAYFLHYLISQEANDLADFHRRVRELPENDRELLTKFINGPQLTGDGDGREASQGLSPRVPE